MANTVPITTGTNHDPSPWPAADGELAAPGRDQSGV